MSGKRAPHSTQGSLLAQKLYAVEHGSSLSGTWHASLAAA